MVINIFGPSQRNFQASPEQISWDVQEKFSKQISFYCALLSTSTALSCTLSCVSADFFYIVDFYKTILYT